MIRSLLRINNFLPGLRVTDDVDALVEISAACYVFFLANDAVVLFFNSNKHRWGDLLLHLFCNLRFRLLTIQLSSGEGEPRKNRN